MTIPRTMRIPRLGPAVVASLALATTSPGIARGQDAPKTANPPATVGETIRSKVGGAVESLKRGTTNASEALRDQIARARDTVNRFGIEQRVYARLHWDKTLFNEPIELSSPRTGAIILSGAVADAAARAKAVALATDTLGVTEVIDHLTVRASVEGAAPARPDRTPDRDR